MDIYKINDIGELIKGNPYVGRGIVIGLSANGTKAAAAYFIMGRSENSRNRVFTENGDEVTIYPFNSTKVGDPSLIIYSPIRKINNTLIVTNGDQTDTVYDFIKSGKTFEEALDTRTFEPDIPNFTPRISAALTFSKNDLTYKMNILKSVDAEGSACCRQTFSYPSVNGLGHFIHTYVCDGNPIPTFTGECERVKIPNTAKELADEIWNSLDENNKISLYVRYVSLADGKTENIMINKHNAEERK